MNNPERLLVNPEKLSVEQIAVMLANFRQSERYVGVYLNDQSIDTLLIDTDDYSRMIGEPPEKQWDFFQGKAERAKSAERIVFCDYTKEVKDKTTALLEDLRSEAFNPDISIPDVRLSNRQIARKMDEWKINRPERKHTVVFSVLQLLIRRSVARQKKR